MALDAEKKENDIVVFSVRRPTYQPCPFGSGLRKFELDLVAVIFFKNAEKIISGGMILYLEKFGLIQYTNFLQKMFV